MVYRYFTVDRSGVLAPGTATLQVFSDLDPAVLQRYVAETFPEGVSRHGDRYLLSAGSSGKAVEPLIELLWEHGRCAIAPAAPSRFQSMFAFETVDEAQQFRSEFCAGSGRVWRLETGHGGFRADLRWLSLRGSALEVAYAVSSYWRQQSTADLPAQLSPRTPLWEVLLRPPIQIVDAVA